MNTTKFINDNFLLRNKYAEELYHNHASKMPIIDYHCHLSPKDIAENRVFENITKAWLDGDHYKWRAMRTLGINEKYITEMLPMKKNSNNGQKLYLIHFVTPYSIGLN